MGDPDPAAPGQVFRLAGETGKASCFRRRVPYVPPPACGCTNPAACNYDAAATAHVESACDYASCVPPPLCQAQRDLWAQANISTSHH